MNIRKLTVISLTVLLSLAPVRTMAQSTRAIFKQTADSLAVLLQERTTVHVDLHVTKAVKSGSAYDIHFNQELSDYHWTSDDIEWFKKKIEALAPAGYRGLKVGNVYANKTSLQDLVTPVLRNSGKPSDYKYRYPDIRTDSRAIVTRMDRKPYPKGMSGRHIALWQSHGRYWSDDLQKWSWQRAPLFSTVEDMYTQSYVLPFLIPMLENAGAYVLTPRERDIQKYEVIIDNDKAFDGPREGDQTRRRVLRARRLERCRNRLRRRQEGLRPQREPFHHGNGPSGRMRPDRQQRHRHMVILRAGVRTIRRLCLICEPP